MSETTTGVLAKPAPGRPWYQRWTVIFGAATTALVNFEVAGWLPVGTSEAMKGVAANVETLATAVTSFLTLIGAYRHIAN